MKRVAAIDCGTNSIRLLISDIDTSTNTAIDVVREMRIVRLGEGVDKTNAFLPTALERTFKAVEEYDKLLLKHNVEHVRFVATSATRDAQNKAMFIKGVIDRLRIVPEVIAGVVAKVTLENIRVKANMVMRIVLIPDFICLK